MLQEIVALCERCSQDDNFTPLTEALKQWELTAYYHQAFQENSDSLSEAEAMELALEAQQAARKVT